MEYRLPTTLLSVLFLAIPVHGGNGATTLKSDLSTQAYDLLAANNVLPFKSQSLSANPSLSSPAGKERGVSVRVGPRMRLGASARTIRSSIAEDNANFALKSDLGLSYGIIAFSHPISAGLMVRNLGQRSVYVGGQDPYPTSINGELILGLGPVTTLLGANQSLTDRKTTFKSGIEYGIGLVSLRAGYLLDDYSIETLLAPGQDTLTSIIQGFSTGLAFKLGSLKFDYAIGQSEFEEMTHMAALSFEWGKLDKK